eukprot:1432250-Rhodomonas_salina.1
METRRRRKGGDVGSGQDTDTDSGSRGREATRQRGYETTSQRGKEAKRQRGNEKGGEGMADAEVAGVALLEEAVDLRLRVAVPAFEALARPPHRDDARRHVRQVQVVPVLGEAPLVPRHQAPDEPHLPGPQRTQHCVITPVPRHQQQRSTTKSKGHGPAGRYAGGRCPSGSPGAA